MVPIVVVLEIPIIQCISNLIHKRHVKSIKGKEIGRGSKSFSNVESMAIS